MLIKLFQLWLASFVNCFVKCMSTLDVFQMLNLTLERVTARIPKVLITSKALASRFTNQRADRVSNRLFRIVEKIANAGGDSRYVNPDGGAAPLGSAPSWIAGGVTPTGISVSTNWTEEVALIGQKVEQVAIANVVSEALADLTVMHKNWLDIGLHTDGTGNLATLSAAPAGGVANVNTMPFGARNIEIGQNPDIVNPANNTSRGSLTITNKTAFMGSQNSFQYAGNAPAGSTTNDIVRYGGLTDGTPVWINGLRALISYSATGNLHGIPRATTPQVVSNGFDMGNNPITRSAIMLLKLQRNARISEEDVKGTFWYTHETQINSLKEIGYDMEFIPLSGGKAEGFDPFFRGAVTLEGEMIVKGQHADQQAWYMIVPDAFGWVKFADPYWLQFFGSRVYNTYNSGGTPNLQYASCMVDFSQCYLDNAAAQGVITGCGVPAGSAFGY
jgi:hypothetical protein